MSSPRRLCMCVFAVSVIIVLHVSLLSDTIASSLLGVSATRPDALSGRRPDDGSWFNFSVPPSLLFFAYTAFVDERTAPAAAEGSAGSNQNRAGFNGGGGAGPRPSTSRGPPSKPFRFYFSLMTDAYKTATSLSRTVDHYCYLLVTGPAF